MAVRKSRVAYQWRSLAQGLARVAKGTLFLGSAVGLAWGAAHLWNSSTVLRISQVTVEGPALPGWAEHPPLKAGQSLFSFSARRLERRLLERYPQLEAVRVRRRWDRGVTLALLPRTPVARVSGSDGWKGVDRSGVVFPIDNRGAGLPLIVSASPQDPLAPALAFLALLRATKEPWTEGLNKIRMSPDGEAVLQLADDLPIYWGDVVLEGRLVTAKARRLGHVLTAPEADAGLAHVRFVDDRRVIIKLNPTRTQGGEDHG